MQSRHFIYKKGRVNSNSRIISTDKDPSLRIESSAIINLRGVSTKLNKYNKFLVRLHGEYNIFVSLLQSFRSVCSRIFISANNKHWWRSGMIINDEDPSLRIESSVIINLRGVSTKLNKYNVNNI